MRMNIDEASKFTGLKKGTIYHYVAAKMIPHIKISTRLIFDEQDLIDWLNSKKVEVIR